jgi:hypothetical protein
MRAAAAIVLAIGMNNLFVGYVCNGRLPRLPWWQAGRCTDQFMNPLLSIIALGLLALGNMTATHIAAGHKDGLRQCRSADRMCYICDMLLYEGY